MTSVQHDLESDHRTIKGWAHGTLAELELIRHAYDDEARDTKRLGRDSFHAESTRRQMQRYVDRWHLGEEWTHPDWSEIA